MQLTTITHPPPFLQNVNKTKICQIVHTDQEQEDKDPLESFLHFIDPFNSILSY